LLHEQNVFDAEDIFLDKASNNLQGIGFVAADVKRLLLLLP